MGAILFVSGLIAALTGDAINTAGRIKGMAIEEELKVNNYAPGVQVYYDCSPYLDAEYDVLKIAKDIKSDWPGIQLPEAIKVGHMAIAKDMMERETTYKYHAGKRYEMFDLDKYIKEENKKDVFDAEKYMIK